MLIWNFRGDPSYSTSTFLKMARAYGNFLYDVFHAVVTRIGLETQAVFSWILMLTWNFGGDPSYSTSTFLKMASTYENFLYDVFHAVVTRIGW